MAEEMTAHIETKKLSVLNPAEGTCHVEAEMILPEYKEEAERILRATPKAVIKSKRLYMRDRNLICELDGTVGFHILYQVAGTGEAEHVSSFLYSENFSQNFQIPCEDETVSAEDFLVFAEAAVRTSQVKLIGPGKLSAKCEVELSLDVKANKSLNLLSQGENEVLITRGSQMPLTRLHAKHGEQMRFSQTISLPAAYLPIGEVCEMEAVLLAQNVVAEDGGVSFRGVCDLHCSYTAAGENTFISFYQPIEFESRVGIPALSADHLCRVMLTPTALKAGADINEAGENKNLLFELEYLCEVIAFAKENVFVMEDAFSTQNELLVERKREEAQELLGSFDFTDAIKAKLPMENRDMVRAEGICSALEFRNSYLEEGKICLEGELSVSYLGIAETGEIKHYRDTHEFKTLVSAPFPIPAGEECSVEVSGCARGVDLIPDSETCDLRYELCGCICVWVTHRPEVVCSLTTTEPLEKTAGEILFIYPREGEELWDLAKEYHISPEKIKAQNHLIGEKLPCYLKLIP